MILLGLLISLGAGYVVFQYYATPFKQIKQIKQQKLFLQNFKKATDDENLKKGFAELRKAYENNEISYNFWKVTYHDIDFNNLHEVEKWKKYLCS